MPSLTASHVFPKATGGRGSFKKGVALMELGSRTPRESSQRDKALPKSNEATLGAAKMGER